MLSIDSGNNFTTSSAPISQRVLPVFFQDPIAWIYFPIGHPYDIGRADMLGLFVLACEECGFVRLYHRSVIAAWIERNPYSSAEI